MKNPTLILPGFHLQTLRKRPRSEQQILADERKRIQQKSLSQLGNCFGKFISSIHLLPTRSGASSRQRILSTENTFWTFFSQVLDADSGCQEAVRKLQAYAALKSMAMPSSSTAAYCKARGRLSPLDFIAKLAALVLKPRVNFTRFHGVFAPNSKYRVDVTPAKRGKGCARKENEDKTQEQRHQAMTWAQRLKRVFNIPQGTLS